MDRLPAEIISEIVSYLKALGRTHYNLWRTNLSTYATINRTWQSVIEHETFSRISIFSTMLPKLTAILSGATRDRRIRSIRVLEFHYVTDLMAPAQHSELGEQEHLPNEFFSEDMKALFGLLKGWEERLGGSERVAAERYQLSLFLGRGWGTDVPDLPLTPPPTEDIVRAPWPDVRYIGEEKLPELSLVSWVTLCERHGIHPESLMQIVSRMKCLDRFEGDIFEEGWSLGRTREYRKGMWLWLSRFV
jgi:hypothetical protein